MEFNSSKLSNSKLWVNYTSRAISYLKEVQAKFNPIVPRNISKWSYVQILLCQLSNLDIKYNNLSFGDPNWVIPIGEETLEP